jgi:membrane-bound inhibitor of C-type lysozyme
MLAVAGSRQRRSEVISSFFTKLESVMKSAILTSLCVATLLAGCNERASEEPTAEDMAAMAPAARVDMPSTPVPADTTGPITYTCEPAIELSVVYVNAAAPPGQARLTLDGSQYVLDQVLSGSGARYMTQQGRSPGATLVWWSKGRGGMLLEGQIGDVEAEEASLADCTEAA